MGRFDGSDTFSTCGIAWADPMDASPLPPEQFNLTSTIRPIWTHDSVLPAPTSDVASRDQLDFINITPKPS